MSPWHLNCCCRPMVLWKTDLSPWGLSLVIGRCLILASIRPEVTVNDCSCGPQQIMYQTGGQNNPASLSFGWNNCEVNSTQTHRQPQDNQTQIALSGNCSWTLPELAPSLCCLSPSHTPTYGSWDHFSNYCSQDLVLVSAIRDLQPNTYP